MNVLEELERLMSQVAGVDLAAVKPETEYRTELGLDSADLIRVLLSIERTLGVRIDETETEPARTVAQFAELVEAKLAAR